MSLIACSTCRTLQPTSYYRANSPRHAKRGYRSYECVSCHRDRMRRQWRDRNPDRPTRKVDPAIEAPAPVDLAVALGYRPVRPSMPSRVYVHADD
jgi:hypothetical protein